MLRGFSEIITTPGVRSGKACTVSNDEKINASFYDAFRLSAEYLGMEYGPVWHGWVAEDEEPSTKLETETSG